MKRETLKKAIDEILIDYCGLEKTYFSSKPNNGENILVQQELLVDPLDWFEVLYKIETKCKILVNDKLLIKPDITYAEFIDVFYNEIEREKRQNDSCNSWFKKY